MKITFESDGSIDDLLKLQSVLAGLINDLAPTDKAEKQVVDVYVPNLELSTRTMNALINSEINTLADLVSCTQTQLFAIPSIGSRSLKEIKASLALRGLKLKGQK